MEQHTADEKKPAQGGHGQNVEMDVLDYVEKRSAVTLDVARKIYDSLHERIYKLATALVAGGGAVSAYVWGQIAKNAVLIAWLPLATLALCWFGVASYLVWVGVMGERLSPGNSPENLLNYHNDLLTLGRDESEAMAETRLEEMKLETERIRDYGLACDRRAQALNRAYRAVVLLSPLAPMATAGAAWALGFLC